MTVDVDGRARRPGWRQVLAVQQPRRVAAVVLAVASATFAYAAVLLVVLDAGTWWGRSLEGTAAVYAFPLAMVFVLAWRRCTEPRGLAAFLGSAWIGVTLVTWLPRQRPAGWSELGQLTWWAVWAVLIFATVPILYARAVGQRLRSYGLRLGLFRGELAIFAVLLPALLAGAYLSAGQARFQDLYPFYRGWPGGADLPIGLLAWWLLYASTFVALEFFFRGFMVTAGFRFLGWWAIPTMAVPYCLLHLDKPVPELVTSLFGGLLLGVIARRTGSILAGVLAHVTLAIGTDAAVLLRR